MFTVKYGTQKVWNKKIYKILLKNSIIQLLNYFWKHAFQLKTDRMRML